MSVAMASRYSARMSSINGFPRTWMGGWDDNRRCPDGTADDVPVVAPASSAASALRVTRGRISPLCGICRHEWEEHDDNEAGSLMPCTIAGCHCLDYESSTRSEDA